MDGVSKDGKGPQHLGPSFEAAHRNRLLPISAPLSAEVRQA
jgi:hypothetical protein